jgi:hypothetical protein
MATNIMQSTFILWRRLDRAGHEVARLTERVAGPTVEGTAVFAEQGQPCRLDYRVACDAAWRTVSAHVTGWLGERAIAMDITADSKRRWVLDGAECAHVHGCDDVDLSFSPVTNLLPIRRLRMNIGERAAVRAAWVDFPACRLEPLDQVYERISDSTYRYESGDGAFVASLQVNAAGLVTSYPGFWHEDGVD